MCVRAVTCRKSACVVKDVAAALTVNCRVTYTSVSGRDGCVQMCTYVCMCVVFFSSE